jgi:hypothetical protein
VRGHVIGQHRESDEADLGPRDRVRERAVSAGHDRSSDLVARRVKREPHGALETAEQVVVLRDIREPRVRAGVRAEKGVAWPSGNPHRDRRVDALDPADGDLPPLVFSAPKRRAQRHRLPRGRRGWVARGGVLLSGEGERPQQTVPVRRPSESIAPVPDHEDRPWPSGNEQRDRGRERGGGQDTSGLARPVTAA